MLVLPMDISGNVAIAILALAILAMYLSVLLRATVQVARESAAWLRPTPIRLGQFAWAVLYRPTLRQLQWTLLGAILLIAQGSMPPGDPHHGSLASDHQCHLRCCSDPRLLFAHHATANHHDSWCPRGGGEFQTAHGFALRTAVLDVATQKSGAGMNEAVR
jgi:hypothetical protein